MINIDEKLNISELLNVYGAMLTEHQAEMMRLYYDCDISLFEISEQFGISRQAVRDAIVRGEKALIDMDEKLGLKAKFGAAVEKLNAVVEDIKQGNTDNALSEVIAVLSALEE